MFFHFTYPNGEDSNCFYRDDYKDFFCNYNKNKQLWSNKHTTLSIRYCSDDNKAVSVLLYSHNASQQSFSLYFSSEGNGYYSLGDIRKINNTMDLGDLDIIFEGCCIPPEDVFQVIEDFVENPLIPSSKIKWISTSNMDLTEKYRLLGLLD